MPVLFDSRGNLKAITPIVLSLAEAEQIFVTPFEEDSTRHSLFREYKRYIQDLRNLLDFPFYQWIDGSFVTTIVNPNDIDLVSFIPYAVYWEKEAFVDQRFSKWAVSRYYDRLDAFTVWEYPPEHKSFEVFQADCAYWNDWFGHTRYNRNRKRFVKGFVQINID